MAQPRDTQRQKVYDSENAAFDKRKSEGMTVAEAQAFIDKCCSSAVLRRRYPRAGIEFTVTDGRGRRRACFTPWPYNELRMPRWSRSRWVLLHELAHALTFSRKQAWHSWEFCECYLYLVRVFLGRGQEELLKREFKARRVKYRPPRKRQLTEDQRSAARERILALNAARVAA